MANPVVPKTVYLDPAIAEALDRYAYEQRVTKASVVNAALRKYLPAALLKGAKP